MVLQLKMTVTYVDIEYCNQLCGCDQVRVYNALQSEPSHFLTRFCGSDQPPVIWTESNTARVRFMSDQTFNYKGFSMTVEEAYAG